MLLKLSGYLATYLSDRKIALYSRVRSADCPDRRNCFLLDSCLKSTLMRLISCPAVVEFLSPIKD